MILNEPDLRCLSLLLQNSPA